MSIGHNGGPPLTDLRSGWVAIAREMRNHKIVGFRQFPVKAMDPSQGVMSRAEAWIDLIMECRYETGFVMNGGRRMEIVPGQLVGAVSWLAHRWNWTPMTVRGFLEKLEDAGMIERQQQAKQQTSHDQKNKQHGKHAAVISVCNYSQYQPNEVPQEHAQQQTKQQAKHDESNNIYKDNKLTIEQKKDTSAPQPSLFVAEAPKVDGDFETFWKIYPPGRKQAKGDARKIFARLKKTIGTEVVLTAVRRYAATKPDPKYTPMPSTWLNQGRWEDDAQAATPAAATSGEGAVGPNGRLWGWWHKFAGTTADEPTSMAMIEKHRPNGTWPWWVLGPPPGGVEQSILHPEVVARFKFVEIYRGKIVHE